ncbi:hypothetical protein G9A89_012559 [Geosiphon pyriformis]|nr:hypothetical protein G9A89_012559 [Geosiphon pyriformis]
MYGGNIIAANETILEYTNELWTLNMSISFSVDLPPWEKLNEFEYTQRSESHSASIGGAEFKEMFIFGGHTSQYPPPANSMRIFDPTSETWRIPNSSPTRSFGHSAITSFNEPKIDFFGGGFNGKNNTTLLNDLVIYDSILNTWTKLTKNNSPAPIVRHTDTLLSDGKMFVLGGAFFENVYNFSSMSDIYVYDTFTGEWTRKVAVGDVPAARGLHTAVGTPNNTIIIFGGKENNAT